MSHTFEQNMTEYIYANLLAKAVYYIRVPRSFSWTPLPLNASLGENMQYRMDVTVQNIGSETYVKNVQIRVTNINSSRIQYYKDATFNNNAKVDRLDSPIYPDVLTVGKETPIHSVYFKVLRGPHDDQAAIAHYGIYAEVVPQGHAWNTFFKALA